MLSKQTGRSKEQRIHVIRQDGINLSLPVHDGELCFCLSWGVPPFQSADIQEFFELTAAEIGSTKMPCNPYVPLRRWLLGTICLFSSLG
jgi:hypothetical protein